MVAFFFKFMASLFLGITGFFAAFDPTAATLDLATPWAYGLIGAALPFVLPYISGNVFGSLFKSKKADESGESSKKD
jgi:hypothetical protein